MKLFSKATNKSQGLHGQLGTHPGAPCQVTGNVAPLPFRVWSLVRLLMTGRNQARNPSRTVRSLLFTSCRLQHQHQTLSSVSSAWTSGVLLFSCQVMSDSATLRTAACQAPLSFTISQSLPKLISIQSVMPSNHLILCCPLVLLPSIFPIIRIFSNELSLRIRWPKYWSFSISPSNKYLGLVSFRMDWFDLLTVQGTLKSLLQSHSLKASVLRHAAFFIVQLEKS